SHEMVGKIFTAMDMFLGGVGLVTLMLGAIGIINIMLVTVSERTREIGLMKARGATNRSVRMQFFMEGAFLTRLSGGVPRWAAGSASGLRRYLCLSWGCCPRPRALTHPNLCPCRQLWQWVRFLWRELWRGYIRRARRPCWRRWKL